MRAFARSLCQDASLADDIVQETCLKAWSQIHQYDASRPLAPWLFRILRHEFYQHKRKHRRIVDADVDELMSDVAVEGGQPYICDANVAIRALETLPPNQKDAFVLVVAAGFTYEEAGGILQCSAGTVKSRVSRARESLVWTLEATSARAKPNRIGPADFGSLLGEIDALALPNSA